jgi:hypothetical protein
MSSARALIEVCSSVLGWDTILQAGKSRVRFHLKILGLTYLFPPHYDFGMGRTSNGRITNVRGSKGRPARKTDIPTAISEPTV